MTAFVHQNVLIFALEAAVPDPWGRLQCGIKIKRLGRRTIRHSFIGMILMPYFASRALAGALLCLGLAACPATPPVGPGNAPDTDTMAAVMDKWTRSCALCHVNGEGGAPRVGVVEEWQPRLAQGREVLLTHTIEGFNSMPPLGYCMACERDDFDALIDFMAEGAQ